MYRSILCKFIGQCHVRLMCGKASNTRLLFFKGSSDLWVLQQSNSRCGTVENRIRD